MWLPQGIQLVESERLLDLQRFFGRFLMLSPRHVFP